MAQSLRIKIKGLYTNPSAISEAPDGALDIADNIVIDEESVATPRRGFDRLTGDLGGGIKAKKLFPAQAGTLYAHDGAAVYAYDDANDEWDTIGSSAEPTTDLPRFGEQNGNIYITSAAGVNKVYNSTIIPSGAPRGLTIEGSLTGASGFLNDTKQVAYRVVWGYTDDHDNLILGSPSERVVVANTVGGAATRDVALTITLPNEVTTAFIFQVYRSAQVATAVEPSDELYLCYEGSPAAGDITAGYLSITDSQPDDLTGATIYTASSQEGVLQSNDQPPFALDLCEFRGRMFYVNTKRRQSLNVTQIARLQLNDTVTINSVVYTAAAAEDVPNRKFKFFNAGTIAQDIADTAKSICKVVNRYASNTTINAYYMSGYDDLPGKMMFEGLNYSVTAFAFTSSRTASFTGGGGVVLPITSSADARSNGLAFSKPGLPEAVPAVNMLFIGNESAPIRRIIPLRDSMFVLKDDGIFRITGTDSSSTVVEPFDNTARIIGPETAVVLNNQIFALTDQGVVAITDTGATVVSRPIEDQFLALFGPAMSTIRSVAFGIGYETDRKYLLFMPTLSADTEATQAFVYNFFTNTWTRWGFSAPCGCVRASTGKIYLANPTQPWVYEERKDYSYTDHADYIQDTTIDSVSSNGLTVTISAGTDLIAVGDVLLQSDGSFSVVSDVDDDAVTLTVSFNGSLAAGAVKVLASIPSKIRWIPDTAQNPGVAKQYTECDLLFKRPPLLDSLVTFTSDQSAADSEVTIAGSTPGLWGFFNWGEVNWGGSDTKRPIRTWVPREKQRCTQLSVQFSQDVAFSQYKFEGISLMFEPMGIEVSR
jgi:hypothetical protein